MSVPRTSPRMSVVLASCGDLPVLHRALDALRPVAEELSVEVLVVRAGGANGLAGGGVVRIIAGGASDSPSALRALGMREAKGDIVILTDDQAAVDEPWRETLARRSGGDPRPPTPVDLQTALAAFGILQPDPRA